MPSVISWRRSIARTSSCCFRSSRARGRLPYDFEEIDLSARIGLGRVVHDRVLEGLANHVFESITPQKLVGLAPSRSRPPIRGVRRGRRCGVQLPPVPEAPIGRGASRGGRGGRDEGRLRLRGDGHVEGDALDARPELVRIGKPTGCRRDRPRRGRVPARRCLCAGALADVPSRGAGDGEVRRRR